jgi:hypothetical protein
LKAAPFLQERCGARVRSAGIPAGSPASGLLRRIKVYCGRGALAPLRTLRLCGESLHSLKAAPFLQERCGARIRSAGIPAGSPASGLLRRIKVYCGRGALAPLRTLRLCGESLHSLKAASFSREGRGARVRSAGIPAGSPASGLLRRAAPTAGKGPLTGEVPWLLCALCALCVLCGE